MESSTPYTNEIIYSVLSNADFENMHSEDLGSDENLIVVPLRPVKFSQHVKADSIPLQYLVLVETSWGAIRKGNIALFYPDDPFVESLPAGTFTDFRKKLSVSVDGRIEWLTLGDVSLFRYVFQGGLPVSSEVLQSEIDNSREGEICFAYYLVLTQYAMIEGELVMTNRTETFLFTSCTGGGGSGGNGGGGGNGTPSGNENCPPGSEFCDTGVFQGNNNSEEEEQTVVTNAQSIQFFHYIRNGDNLILSSNLTAEGFSFRNSTANVFTGIISVSLALKSVMLILTIRHTGQMLLSHIFLILPVAQLGES